MRDPVLRNGMFEGSLDMLLVDHIGERLRPVFAGDDLIHGRANARPRVIRGTQVKPLPLLPSGPGGVRGRPLHGARDLTIDYRSMRVFYGSALSKDPAARKTLKKIVAIRT